MMKTRAHHAPKKDAAGKHNAQIIWLIITETVRGTKSNSNKQC